MDLIALRVSYDKYVKKQTKKIEKVGNKQYAEMAEAIYKATVKALDPSIHHMHIISAQTGSGKSTYMEAMAAALYKNGLSCSILAKTINQSHVIYKNVAKLVKQKTGKKKLAKEVKYLKGSNDPKKNKPFELKLAIYTSVHKDDSKKGISEYDIKPEERDRYSREDKIRAPIVVSTHAALLTELEEDFDSGIQKRHGKNRDVIFLDESPDFNISNSISKGAIEKIKDELTGDEYKEHNKAITKLQKRYQKLINSSKKKEGQYLTDLQLLRPELIQLFTNTYGNYFDSETYSKQEAEDLNEKESKLQLHELFNREGKLDKYNEFLQFINCLDKGQSFFSKYKDKIIYSNDVFVNNQAFILLDATAEIEEFDYFNKVSKMSFIQSPKVTYTRTKFRYFMPPNKFIGAGTSIKSEEYLRDFRKYVIDNTIKHSKKGDEILIIVKKRVAESLYKELKIDAYDSKKCDDRFLHIIYWGSFIGANHWKNIKKVFLYTGFQRPKVIYIGKDAAYKGEVTEEFLKEQSGSSLVGDVLRLKENESLKWFKQLSARGNIRNISDKGEAYEMEIYTDTDLLWLIQNQERAFPDSPKMEFIGSNSDGPTDGGTQIVMYLAWHKTGICNYQDLADAAGYKGTKKIGRVLGEAKVAFALNYLGWGKAKKSDYPEYEAEGNQRLVKKSIYKK